MDKEADERTAHGLRILRRTEPDFDKLHALGQLNGRVSRMMSSKDESRILLDMVTNLLEYLTRQTPVLDCGR
jgi:hypothetical protein